MRIRPLGWVVLVVIALAIAWAAADGFGLEPPRDIDAEITPNQTMAGLLLGLALLASFTRHTRRN